MLGPSLGLGKSALEKTEPRRIHKKSLGKWWTTNHANLSSEISPCSLGMGCGMQHDVTLIPTIWLTLFCEIFANSDSVPICCIKICEPFHSCDTSTELFSSPSSPFGPIEIPEKFCTYDLIYWIWLSGNSVNHVIVYPCLSHVMTYIYDVYATTEFACDFWLNGPIPLLLGIGFVPE